MGKGSRLLAKGEKIIFDTEEGEKIYTLKPLKNYQLLEITEKGEQKKGMEATMLMVKYSLNNSPEIVNGIEQPFDDEEIKEMPTPFLLQTLKLAAKLNGLEEMFDFQAREQGKGLTTPNPSQPESKPDIFEVLNKNPVKKLS